MKKVFPVPEQQVKEYSPATDQVALARRLVLTCLSFSVTSEGEDCRGKRECVVWGGGEGGGKC